MREEVILTLRADARGAGRDFQRQFARPARRGVDNVSRGFTRARSAADRFQRSSKRAGRSFGPSMNRELREIKQTLTGLDRQYRTLGSRVEGLRRPFGSLKSIAGGLGVTLGAVGGIRLFGNTIKDAITLETAFVAAEKTLEGTPEQFAALRDVIDDMTRTIPLAAQELAEIASIGGQLGVAVEDVEAFVRAIAEISSSAPSLTTEEAAIGLARLSNVLGIATADIGNLGSAMVALGNTAATNEREIIDFSLRIAGAGKQVGLSVGEIVGLSASLAEVGLRVEAGGTAISKLMIRMAADVATGGGQIRNFARVANVSVSEFSRIFRDDAAAAVHLFLQGLGNLDKESGEAILTLQKMGLEEVRLRNALLLASEATEDLRQNMALGNTAFAEGTAASIEAAKAFGTTGSSLTILRNAFSKLGRVITSDAFEGIGSAADAVSAFVFSVADALENADLDGALDAVFGADFVADVRAAFDEISGFVSARIREIVVAVQESEIGTLFTAIGREWIDQLKTQISAIIAVVRSFGALFERSFANGFGGAVDLAIATVEGILTAMHLLQRGIGAARDFLFAIGADLVSAILTPEAVEELRGLGREAVTAVFSIFETLRDFVQTQWTQLVRLWELGGDETTSALALAWDNVKIIASAAFDALINIVRNAFRIVGGLFQVVGGLLTGDWSRVWAGIKNVTVGFLDTIVNSIGAALQASARQMANFVTFAIDTVNSLASVLPESFTGLSVIGETVGDALKSGLERGVASIGEITETVRTSLDVWAASGETAQEAVSALTEEFVDVEDALSTAESTVTDTAAAVEGLGDGADRTSGFVKQLSEDAQELIDAFQAFQSAPETILTQLSLLERQTSDVDQVVEFMSRGIDTLKKRFDDLSPALQVNARRWIELNDARKGAAESAKELENRERELFEEVGKLPALADDVIRDLKTLEELQADDATTVRVLAGVVETLADNLDALTEAQRDALSPLIELVRGHKDAAKEAANWSKTVDDAKEAVDDYRNRLPDTVRLLDLYVEVSGSAEAASRIFGAEILAAVEALEDQNAVLPENIELLNRLAEAAQDTSEDYRESFADAFESVLDDGSELLGDLVRENKSITEVLNDIWRDWAGEVLDIISRIFLDPFRNLLRGLGQTLFDSLGLGDLSGSLNRAIGGGQGGGIPGLGNLGGGIPGGILGLTGLGGVLGGSIGGITGAVIGGVGGLTLAGGLAGASGGIGFGAGALGTLGGLGSTIGGGLAALFTNPFTGIPAGIGLALAALFGFGGRGLGDAQQDVTRDFGIEIPKPDITAFLEAVGIAEETYLDFTKSISGSPKFFEEVLLETARATGTVDELIASFGRFEAFGQTFDFSAAAAAAAAGDYTELNRVWSELFAGSDQLIDAIGGLDTLLSDTVSSGLTEAEEAALRLAEALEALNDPTRLAALQDAFGRFVDPDSTLTPLEQIRAALGHVVESSSNAVAALASVRSAFKDAEGGPDSGGGFGLPTGGGSAPGVGSPSASDTELLEQLETLLDFQESISRGFDELTAAGTRWSELLVLMGSELTSALEITEAFGLTLSDGATFVAEWAARLDGAAESTIAAVAAFLDLRQAPELAARSIEAMSTTLTLLSANGATNSEILQILGLDLLALVESAERFGLMLPDIVAQFVELAEAERDAANATQELVDARTDLERAFDAGFDSVAEVRREADLFAASIFGWASAVRENGIPTADLQAEAWRRNGAQALDYNNELLRTGETVPELITQMLRWAETLGFVEIAADGTARAVEEIVDVAAASVSALDGLSRNVFRNPVLRGGGSVNADAVRSLLSSTDPVEIALSSDAERDFDRILNPPVTSPLVGASEEERLLEAANKKLTFIDGLTDRVLSVSSITETEAENLAARFGGIISSLGPSFQDAADDLEAAASRVPVAVASAGRGLTESVAPARSAFDGLRETFAATGLTADNFSGRLSSLDLDTSSLTTTILSLGERIIEGANSFDAWSVEGEELADRITAVRGELSETNTAAATSAQTWNLVGDAVIEAANRYQSIGQALPDVIAAELEWAKANGRVTISLDGTVQAADSLLERYVQLGVDAIHTGEGMNELVGIIENFTDAQTAANFALNVARVQELEGYRSELTALQQGLQQFIPVQRTAVELFLETGEVSDALATSIVAAGGSLAAFEDLGGLIAARNSLAALADVIEATGKISQEQVDLILEFASPAVGEAFRSLLDNMSAGADGLIDLGSLSRDQADIVSGAFASAGENIRESLGSAAAFLDTEIGGIIFGLDREMALVTAAITTTFQEVGAAIISAIMGTPLAWDQVKDHIGRNPIKGDVQVTGSGLLKGPASKVAETPFADVRNDWEFTGSLVESNPIKGVVRTNAFADEIRAEWAVVKAAIEADPINPFGGGVSDGFTAALQTVSVPSADVSATPTTTVLPLQTGTAKVESAQTSATGVTIQKVEVHNTFDNDFDLRTEDGSRITQARLVREVLIPELIRQVERTEAGEELGRALLNSGGLKAAINRKSG